MDDRERYTAAWRMPSPEAQTEAVRLYLELLKRSLLGELTGSSEKIIPVHLPRLHTRLVQRLLAKRGLILSQLLTEDPSERLEGRIWPLHALTMIGRARLDNLQRCTEDVIAEGVLGDCIEAGVWRGGASMFMRAILNVYGEHSRRVWLADSFQGLPPPDPRYPADQRGTFHNQAALAVSLEEVKRNFERFGLLDDRVEFVKGWFANTLPSLSHVKWSVIRLDGDMYQSTMDSLNHLYPNLSPGGWVIVDDYEIEACRRAVEDYRSRHRITERLSVIDWTGVCWRRDS